jgi:hypothetical protein
MLSGASGLVLGLLALGLVVWLGICYYTVFLFYFNKIR